MFPPDFFPLFKDYLPILGGLFTLTAAGAFGYLLQHLKSLSDTTPEKILQEVILLKSQLKSTKQLDRVDEDRLNRIIYGLKEKAITEYEGNAKGRKDIANKVLRKIGFLSTLASIIALVEIVVYGSIIYGIVTQSVIPPLLALSVISVQFLWETRKAD